MSKCPVCGISEEVRGGRVVFITSIGAELSPDDLKSKVCIFARTSGCINKKGNSDSGGGWPTNEGLDKKSTDFLTSEKLIADVEKHGLNYKVENLEEIDKPFHERG